MSDLMSAFEVKTLVPLRLGALDISLTNSSLFMVLTVLLICGLLAFGLRDSGVIPAKMRYCIEKVYLYMKNVVAENMPYGSNEVFPYIFAVFLFISVGNLFGLVPGAFSFTSQLAVTLGMALLVFFSSIIVGLLRQGTQFFRRFCPQGAPGYLMPFLIIVEVTSFLFRPVSLAVRLFANMMSGHVMLEVIAGFAVSLMAAKSFIKPVAVLPILIDVALNVLKLAICVLQAYVFSVLSSVYLAESLEPAPGKM